MENLATVLLAVLFNLTVWAWPFSEETIGSRLWTFEVSNGEATVHGVEPAEGALVIPKTLGGVHGGIPLFFSVRGIVATR